MIIVWRITERCNLSCPFCAYDRTLRRSRRDADPGAVDQFCRVLGEYRRRTGERILVSWLGGEPLLSSAEEMRDFRVFLQKKGIKFILVPSG